MLNYVRNGAKVFRQTFRQSKPINDLNCEEKVRHLIEYYLKNLVQDPIDGTRFDCDVLDALESLEKKYKELK